MVEKISFTPEEIRGYGNIVSVHSLDDYECYDGILTETTDTIDGATVTVYEMEYQTDTEATTISMTASSQSFVVGGSVTFTATLLDNELSGVSGVTITFKDGTSTLGTGTTNSSGVATYTTSGLASGSHSITAVFAGNSSYTASTSSAVSVTVLAHNYHLEFGSNSYTTDLNGDVTITCTLTDNSVAVSSASVSLTGTGVSTSATTDSNGLATFNLTGLTTDTTLTATYSGATATCTVTVQTPTIYYQSAMTSDDGKWQKSSTSGMSVTYDATNGCTVKGTTNSDRTYYINTSSVSIPNSDIVVEFDITAAALGAYNNSTELVVHNSKVLLENSNLECRPMSNNDDRTTMVSNPTYPVHIKCEITSTNIYVYCDGVLKKTILVSSSYRRIGFKTYRDRSASMKNLIVYELV